MARYIDAELLIRKSVEEKRFFIASENLLEQGYDVKTVYGDLAEVVASIPTADVAEVVRCKECKHWNIENKRIGHFQCDIFCDCYGRGYPTNPDDFCSYGKRKDT